MNRNAERNYERIAIVALAVGLTVGAGVPAAAAEGPWLVKLSGVSAQTTSGGERDGSLGGGLAVEYRVTPRVGLELGGLTGDFEGDVDFLFTVPEVFLETEVRMTPLLARLNLHLTPGRRADVYVGPVAGWVEMSDLSLHARSLIPGQTEFTATQRFETENPFVWGAHVGLDARLGNGGSHLTAGATYLDLALELELPSGEPFTNAVDFSPLEDDLDPVVFQVGYSYRF